MIEANAAATLAQVILFSLVGGLFSLVGGVALLSSKTRAARLAVYATPFAAGALLAAAFMDLLRESVREGHAEQALTFTLVGILTFFILERFLRWFHHHHDHGNAVSDPKIPLIVIGDTVHNAIDGVAIAAGFLLSPTTGMVVTLAVAAHEIPQEIGDFGLLLHKGMERSRVLVVNALSALATTATATITFLIGHGSTLPMGAVLGLVAGFFIYVAVSDIIPSIHKNEENVIAGPQTLLLIAGVIIISGLTLLLHRFIG